MIHKPALYDIIDLNTILSTLQTHSNKFKNSFFDYEAKYTEGKCEEIVPARLSEEITKKVQEYALKVFELVKAKGFIRVDFVIKDNDPVILEMNTIPGLTPNSLLPKEAKAAGIEYPQLLDKMIELALEGQRFWDIRRWNLANQYFNKSLQGWDINQSETNEYYKLNTYFIRNYEDRENLWPLKDYDCIVNPKLVQNPGW